VNDAALTLENVSRSFGDTVAVRDLSLVVEFGQMVCLLGHNGAGKTTTVRMAATLLTPDSGRITIDGVDGLVRPRVARRRTGLVLGGERGFYTRSTARANLMFYADVAGVPSRERRARVDEALCVVGPTERGSHPVGDYSRGMVQRLHIARALLTRPRLLVLDEPSSGLDVQAARDLRELVRLRANEGVGVLLTTHSMGEAELLGDRIDIIRRGQLMVSGDASAVARAAGITAVTTVLTRSKEDLGATFEQLTGVARVDTLVMHGSDRLQPALADRSQRVSSRRSWPFQRASPRGCSHSWHETHWWWRTPLPGCYRSRPEQSCRRRISPPPCGRWRTSCPERGRCDLYVQKCRSGSASVRRCAWAWVGFSSRFLRSDEPNGATAWASPTRCPSDWGNPYSPGRHTRNR